jgi:excisionase family DNA binding protein
MYVGQLRREQHSDARELHSNEKRILAGEGFGRLTPVANGGDEEPITLVRVPKRRLLSAKAAAQYLGIHEQTLKKITARGDIKARRIGSRRVYLLEELDRYVESLPVSA